MANVWSAGLSGLGGEPGKKKDRVAGEDPGSAGSEYEKSQEWLATSSDEGDLNDEKNPDFDVS